jgi:hypothetical protein
MNVVVFQALFENNRPARFSVAQNQVFSSAKVFQETNSVMINNMFFIMNYSNSSRIVN